MLPLLLRQHRETEVATRKKAILDVLLEFLEANKALYGSADGDVESEFKVGSVSLDIALTWIYQQKWNPLHRLLC